MAGHGRGFCHARERAVVEMIQMAICFFDLCLELRFGHRFELMDLCSQTDFLSLSDCLQLSLLLVHFLELQQLLSKLNVLLLGCLLLMLLLNFALLSLHFVLLRNSLTVLDDLELLLDGLLLFSLLLMQSSILSLGLLDLM